MGRPLMCAGIESVKRVLEMCAEGRTTCTECAGWASCAATATGAKGAPSGLTLAGMTKDVSCNLEVFVTSELSVLPRPIMLHFVIHYRLKDV